MNKPPAFQFYADDFLSGTMNMTDAEVGLYIRLLCVQWSTGSIPNDDEEIRAYSKRGLVEPSLNRVKSKFEASPDGLLRNRRLEAERLKQTAYRDRQSEFGRRSAEARLNQPSTNPQPTHQPKPNSPSPSPSPVQEGVQRVVNASGDEKASSPLSLEEKRGKGFSLAEKISAEKELPRIEKRLNAINNDHLDQGDREELRALKKRRKELKDILGYLV
jgi:uncharacterized protein YdaU (DUF1376 family)